MNDEAVVGPAVRLMVVDDHEVLRQGLRFMLRNEAEFAIVAEAADGRAALESLQSMRPDVLLLDLKMPGIDGLEILGRIREQWPELPVLIFTMYDDPEFVEEALRCGASGYLLKSVSREELLRAIRAVASGAGYLQAEITRPVRARFARTAPMGEYPRLSPRETEVLELLAEGLANKQIARRLGLTEATVKGYLSQLFEKLGAADRAHAVALALRSRLID